MAKVASSANTNGTGTVAVTMPSGLAVGDLILVFLSQLLSGGSSGVTPPAGFTQVTTNSSSTGGGNTVASYLWYRIAGASEPATYNFITASGNANYEALRVTNWDATYTLTDFNSGTYNSGTTSLTTNAFTLSAFSIVRGNDLILLFTSQLAGDVTPSTSGQTWASVVNDTNSLPLSILSTNAGAITTFPATTITPTASASRQTNVYIGLSVRSYNIVVPSFVLTATMNPPLFRRLIQAPSFILTGVMTVPAVSAVKSAVQNLAKNAVQSVVNLTKH